MNSFLYLSVTSVDFLSICGTLSSTKVNVTMEFGKRRVNLARGF
ncbi:hypothetical protein DsansV1_C04g0043451 [Dioscorea sansibarensis]